MAENYSEDFNEVLSSEVCLNSLVIIIFTSGFFGINDCHVIFFLSHPLINCNENHSKDLS